MIIAWDNLADTALVSAQSQVATLPASHVQQPHLSRKWATEAGSLLDVLWFDMGSAVSCSVIAVLGTNLSASAQMNVAASDTDPFMGTTIYNSGTLDCGDYGIKAGYGAAYFAFPPTAARYWRLVLSDLTNPDDHLEVGRIFLGPSWTPSVNQEWDWGVLPLDESPVVSSYGGQDYPDPRPQKRVLMFELTWLSEAEMYGNAFAMARAQGVVSDVLAIPDINGAYVSEQAVWGRVAASQPLLQKSLHRYYQKFQIKERL